MHIYMSLETTYDWNIFLISIYIYIYAYFLL